MEEEEEHQKRQRAPPPRLPCARCGSGDTKFCYYNNYNTSQPRYYCRTCKRHWTHGGTLRNVPEGGSSSKKNHRKNRKLSPSSSSVAATADELKLPAQPQMMHAAPAITAAAGIGAFLPPLPPFFYNGGGGRAAGLVRNELSALQIPGGGGVAGDFPLAPPGVNPLDGISMQRLVQQPPLSLAVHHQNLLMFQQLQQQSNAAAPLATADQNQIRHRSNATMFFNTASSPTQPPPPP